jgi:hypothetical protein
MAALSFNLVEIVLGLAICTAVLYCIFKGFKYVSCDIALKDETIQGWKLSIYHPAFLCIHKFVIGLFMGTLYDVKHRVFAILIIQLIYTVLCFVRNPFKKIYMFVRQLICQVTILFTIIVVAVY